MHKAIQISQGVALAATVAAALYLVIKNRKRLWAWFCAEPEEERSLVIGHLDDGTLVVCDDPDCDIDKTLEMWRNGFE